MQPLPFRRSDAFLVLGAVLVAAYSAASSALLSLPGAAALAFWVLVPSAVVRGREKKKKGPKPSAGLQWVTLGLWFCVLVAVLAVEFRFGPRSGMASGEIEVLRRAASYSP